MKSPFKISYTDLIKEQERQLKSMEQAFPSLVNAGSLSAHTARKRIECAKAIVRLLRKHKREPQASLFDYFEKKK